MPRSTESTNKHKKALLQALKANLWIVTPSCEQAGVDRTTHYLWLEKDPEYKAEYERIGEQTIDFAENALLKSIKGGSDTATIFYLKTKGKKRGYIERQEIQNEVQGNVTINISSL
jgi:hypothetical protein